MGWGEGGLNKWIIITKQPKSVVNEWLLKLVEVALRKATLMRSMASATVLAAFDGASCVAQDDRNVKSTAHNYGT